MYSLLSRERSTAFKKSAKNMAIGGTLIGAGVAAGAGAAQRGIEGIFGINRKKEQIEQQEKLNKLQEEANNRLLEKSYGLQREMYDYTYNKNTPLQQRKNLEEAGLNPALLYGIGGQGGADTGGGGASISGSQASDEATGRAAEAQQAQLALLNSQVKVNESVAEKNEAEAEKAGAETETEENKRDIFIENLRQAGIQTWIDNQKEKFKTGGEPEGESWSWNIKLDDWIEIKNEGLFNKQISAELAKTLAETGNQEAQRILTSEKAEGYWKELLNATIQANAAEKIGNAAEENAASKKIEAEAYKLAQEWETGEYVNWKTWTELAKEATDIAVKAITKGGNKKGK